MRANPDGYTIQLGNMGTHAAAVAFYPNLAWSSTSLPTRSTRHSTRPMCASGCSIWAAIFRTRPSADNSLSLRS
jgi:hypothetical protein